MWFRENSSFVTWPLTFINWSRSINPLETGGNQAKVQNIYQFLWNFTCPFVTLKMRSRSQKSNTLRACPNGTSMSVWRKSIHWFKRYPTYKIMTLKMGSRSPKPVYIIFPLKADDYSSTCSRNISILTSKPTFVGWVWPWKWVFNVIET